MEKLKSVQYSAARAVTGGWRETSWDRLYDELGWELLNFERWTRRLILFYKIVSNLTPDYTRYPFPNLRKSTYELSRRSAIGQVFARMKGFNSSFYPNCLLEWDRLNQDIRQSNSLAIFKRKLFSIIRPSAKSDFGIQNPRGLSILTQLHVCFSRIKFHKFKHNFNDTTNPLCPINDGVEDREHYFLLCHMYDDIRRDLLNGLNAVLLPHGIGNLSNDEFVNILLYGMKFFHFK